MHRSYLAFAPLVLTLAGCQPDDEPAVALGNSAEEIVAKRAAVGSLLRATVAMNLRERESTSSRILGVVPEGGLVYVRAASKGDFFAAWYDGYEGFVNDGGGVYFELVGTPPDPARTEAAPTWDCAGSAYGGGQFWSCNGQSTVYACKDGNPKSVQCANGCIRLAAGLDDVCAVEAKATSTPPPPPPATAPEVVLPELRVRGAADMIVLHDELAAGLRTEIEKIHRFVPESVGITLPPVTIDFVRRGGEANCTGICDSASSTINVDCSPRQSLRGPSVNTTLNITMHELGHYLAHWLIAPASRQNVVGVNEGLATWISADWWSYANGAGVGSLRAAANATGLPADMWSGVRPSDSWYKVYGSFFEFLESRPGAIRTVANDNAKIADHQAAWAEWLQ